jgi:hypothetical protein
MKKMVGLLVGGILLFNSFVSNAQSYAESALLFSRLMPAGSARIQSLGGAQTSLGGDYSSAQSNPAGLGMFNKSEFTISPGLNMNSTSSSYLGTNTNGSKTTFEIPGISLVLHNTKEDNGSGFLGGTFGVSLSRTNEFNRNFSYGGTNKSSSIVDYFVSDATGDNISQFDAGTSTSDPGYNYNYPTGLAYSSYLIDPTTPTSTNYRSVLDPQSNEVRSLSQREDIKLSGGQSQVNLAYGANFFDKIFVGGGIGISSIKYQSSKNYLESNYSFSQSPGFNPLNSLLLTESLKTSGIGFNATLGVIGRPVDFLQVGLSYTSPTIYSVNDTYSAYMSTNWNNFDVGSYYGGGSNVQNGPVSYQADPVLSQYSLQTPSRLNLGLTVFVKKSGFITGDVEMVNYAGAKYISSSVSPMDFSGDNSDIKSAVQRTFNFKVGAEYRIKSFRVRLGGSFMPSPFRYPDGGYGVSQDITAYTGGVGYRTSKFYIDLGIVMRQGNNGYSPYGFSPSVATKNTNSLAMVTVGFPFSR